MYQYRSSKLEQTRVRATLHVCASGQREDFSLSLKRRWEDSMRRLHAGVRTSAIVCAEYLCMASCYGRLTILWQCVLHSDLSIHHLRALCNWFQRLCLMSPKDHGLLSRRSFRPGSQTAHIYGLADANVHLRLCLLISAALHRWRLCSGWLCYMINSLSHHDDVHALEGSLFELSQSLEQASLLLRCSLSALTSSCASCRDKNMRGHLLLLRARIWSCLQAAPTNTPRVHAYARACAPTPTRIISLLYTCTWSHKTAYTHTCTQWRNQISKDTNRHGQIINGNILSLSCALYLARQTRNRHSHSHRQTHMSDNTQQVCIL
jgi:hypothetical protein